MHFQIKDELENIFETLKQACQINQKGQLLELDFSQIRPTGYFTSSGKNETAGPTAFLKLFDNAINIINPNQRPEPLHKAILKIDHPEILKFISYKSSHSTNFQIFIELNDQFIEAFEKDQDFDLINPTTGNAVNKMHARSVFELILSSGLNPLTNSPELTGKIQQMAAQVGHKKITVATGRIVTQVGQKQIVIGADEVEMKTVIGKNNMDQNQSALPLNLEQNRQHQTFRKSQEVVLPPMVTTAN